MVAIPDPATYRLMPTRNGEAKVGRMICDVVKPDGEPYEGDPRYVLRGALERMKGLGFDTFTWRVPEHRPPESSGSVEAAAAPLMLPGPPAAMTDQARRNVPSALAGP